MATNNATNSPFPLAAAKGGLGLANPTAHGILVGQGASAVTPIVLDTGEILIGITGSDPVAAKLQPGTGIVIDDTSVPGQITISAGSSFVYHEETGTTRTLVVNSYEVANNAALVTATLPAVAPAGSIIHMIGKGAGGWKIGQGASVNIEFGDMSTTVGTGGSLESTHLGDTVSLICITANVKWRVFSSIGNITVV